MQFGLPAICFRADHTPSLLHRQPMYDTMDGRTKIKEVGTQEDILVVELLAREIWLEHYIPIIGEAQVEYMLEKFQSSKAISEQIREGVHYYLVDYHKQTVGYISYYLKDASMFLSKIYLKSSMRGKGLGREMIDFVIEQARAINLDSISLTVNKNNFQSIEAYKKLGFAIEKSIVVDIGSGFVMDDYAMKKQIQ